jgi:hypothetical protein
MQHVDDPAVQLELADMAERAATAMASKPDWTRQRSVSRAVCAFPSTILLLLGGCRRSKHRTFGDLPARWTLLISAWSVRATAVNGHDPDAWAEARRNGVRGSGRCPR